MQHKSVRIFVALAAGGGLVMLGALTAGIVAQGSAGVRATAARPKPRPTPIYDPNKYTPRISNAWYPLKAGVKYVYKGHEGSKHIKDVVKPTHTIKNIAGVPCRVVRDRLYKEGILREKTKDYYTQDEDGNVWYFGEDTKELDKNGNVTSTEGTWRTGRDGAEAGIFMEANPQKGDTFQQEFLQGYAEDHYQVLSLTAEVKVPYGHFGGNKLNRRVELTKEWTPLEPEVRDHKYYVRGIGNVKEQTVKGGNELLKLVKIVMP